MNDEYQRNVEGILSPKGETIIIERGTHSHHNRFTFSKSSSYVCKSECESKYSKLDYTNM